MNYKLKELDRKTTSKGKPMIKATIIDETGQEHKGVAIWSEFPNFANLQVGEMIVADMKVEQDGQYINKSLNYPKPTKTNGYKPIEKAMERKENGIKQSQEAKAENIKVSSTARDATLIVTTFYQGYKLTDEQIKDKWLKWRKWLWFAFDEEPKNYAPFESTEPNVRSDGEPMPFSDDMPPDQVYEEM